jgi:hypothetical protein
VPRSRSTIDPARRPVLFALAIGSVFALTFFVIEGFWEGWSLRSLVGSLIAGLIFFGPVMAWLARRNEVADPAP